MIASVPFRTPFFEADGHTLNRYWLKWFQSIVDEDATEALDSTSYTVADALDWPGLAALAASTAGAYTLAEPSTTDDGQELVVIDTTGNAHTVTAPTGTILDGTGTPKQVATFNGNKGSEFSLVAFNTFWYLTGKNGVVLT